MARDYANPGARRRAEAELVRDPARSDHLIAQLARCTWHRVGIWRCELETTGTIPAIPVSDRTQRLWACWVRRPGRVNCRARHMSRPERDSFLLSHGGRQDGFGWREGPDPADTCHYYSTGSAIRHRAAAA